MQSSICGGRSILFRGLSPENHPPVNFPRPLGVGRSGEEGRWGAEGRKEGRKQSPFDNGDWEFTRAGDEADEGKIDGQKLGFRRRARDGGGVSSGAPSLDENSN